MNKKIHRSMRGKAIDFDSLQASSPQTIAVGNAQYNARGDRLGKGGSIEKTAGEIARETISRETISHGGNPAVKNVSIKNNLDDLRNARNNWVTPDFSNSDPDKALDISQAVDLLDGIPLEEVKAKEFTSEKKSPAKSKRTISDE